MMKKVAIDVLVVTSEFTGATRRAMAAAERREKAKHVRYPGPGLYADVRGKWGREAHAFVQSAVGALPKDERATAIRVCRRQVSVALQTGLAEQMLTAAKTLKIATAVMYGAHLPAAPNARECNP